MVGYKRILAAIGFAVFSGVLLPRAALAESPATYNVPYAMAGDGVYYILQYIAEQAGFYKEEGLEMDPVLVTSGTQLMAGVLGGSTEGTSVNLALVVQAAQKGGDVVAIAPVFNAFPHTLVLSNAAIKKNGITLDMSVDEKVKRLHGLRIGVTSPGSGSDQLVRTLLLKRGYVPDKEISVEPVGQGAAMLAAFEHGLIDGFAFTPPFPQIAEGHGFGKIVIDPFNGDAPELQGGTFLVLATSHATLKRDPAGLRAVVRAFTRAMKFGKEHPEEARKMTRKYFPNMDEAVFNAAFDKGIRGLPTSPILTQDQFNRTIDAVNITAKKPLKADYSALIDTTFAREAQKDIMGH